MRLDDAPTQRVVPPPDVSRCTPARTRSEEHTSELQSQSNLVCRLLLEKKTPSVTLGERSATPPAPADASHPPYSPVAADSSIHRSRPNSKTGPTESPHLLPTLTPQHLN